MREIKKILKKAKKEEGVSLLELLVAVAIFIIVVLSSMQIFHITLKAGREVAASQKMQKDMRYVFEVISKEVRVAQVDKEGACISQDRLYKESGNELKFLNKNGECVTYSLDDESFLVSRGEVKEKLTSEDVVLEGLEFEKKGQVPNSQPLLTIKTEVYPRGYPGQKVTMQTTVSARDYE